jgi:hypothetical protein
MIFLTGRAPPHLVHRKIVGQAKQKDPLIASAVQDVWAFRQLAKDLLQDIPRIRFIPRKIHQERK